ncbi:MAG: DinB family protein [Actinomycetota bacterium]
MSMTVMRDAFAHHTWATMRLLDSCLPLSPEQLGATVPGTYGSILDTVRHLVEADSYYLMVMTGGRIDPIDAGQLDLAELRAVMEGHAPAWQELAAQDLDPDTVVVRRRDDGSESHAPLGIRLAQVVHHGTDHRSQVCTILSTLGVEPPEIDVWDFAADGGQLVEVPPPG